MYLAFFMDLMKKLFDLSLIVLSSSLSMITWCIQRRVGTFKSLETCRLGIMGTLSLLMTYWCILEMRTSIKHHLRCFLSASREHHHYTKFSRCHFWQVGAEGKTVYASLANSRRRLSFQKKSRMAIIIDLP